MGRIKNFLVRGIKKKGVRIALVVIAALLFIILLCQRLDFMHQASLVVTDDFTDYTTIDIDVETHDVTSKLDYDALKKANDDMAAIIRIAGTIEEPIVQALDNRTYERRTLFGEASSAGVPFIDEDSSIETTNTIIWGHSSKYRDVLFTDLMNYKNQEFYEKNSVFKLETEKTIDTYRIFSIFLFDVDGSTGSIHFLTSQWSKPALFQLSLDDIVDRSMYDTGISVSNKDKLCTIVTCDTASDNLRLILVAKRIEVKTK